MHAPRRAAQITYRSRAQQTVGRVRLIKAGAGHSLQDLLRDLGDLDAVGQALIDGDPEIDPELVGRKTGDVQRVYIDSHGSVLHATRVLQVLEDPHGQELSRQEFSANEPTVGEDVRLAWSGKTLPIGELVRRFAFTRNLQLLHHGGPSFDFLYGLAQLLADKQEMLLVRSNSREQRGKLVFQRNGTPYVGFLEGRVRGASYLLVLHLSNLELKRVS